MPDHDDWRLTMGSREHLVGLALAHVRWEATRPGWDHDHCELCWHKIWDGARGTDESVVGWASEDDDRWICETCFSDFRGRFEWVVVDHPDPRRRV